MFSGGAVGATAGWTGVGALLAGGLIAHGGDNASAGVVQMWTGQDTKPAFERLLISFGVSPVNAMAINLAVGTIGGGAGSIYRSSAVLSASSIPKAGQTIVGEGMKRVEMEAAKRPGSVILNNMPEFKGAAHQVTSQMMTYNRQWILEQMRSGRTIIDIGRDIYRTNPSIFY
jgi:hypothetical protein